MPELRLPIRARGVLLKVLLRNPSNFEVHLLPLSAFLDTGASDTMVDLGVLEVLGITPYQQVGLNILGRSDTGYYNTFKIEVAMVVNLTAPRWHPLTVLGGPCFQTGAAIALGRDFLRNHILTYDGPAARAVLSWNQED